MWIRNPSGNYEPWTVLCGTMVAGSEIYRRLRTQPKGEAKRVSKPEELILWIQDHGVEKPLSQVLPYALQLSKLLGHRDLEHWVRLELLGYNQEGGMTEQDVVPEYREITGRYIDSYNRMLQLPSDLHFVNGYRFRYGVRQLEELAKKEKMQNIRDEESIALLRRELNADVYRFCFSPTEIVGVIDRIRNRLLEKVNSVELGEGNKPDNSSKGEKRTTKKVLSVVGVFAAVLSALAAVAVVPEIRSKLGLHNDPEKPVTVGTAIDGTKHGKLKQQAKVESSPGSTVNQYQGQVIVINQPVDKTKELRRGEQSVPQSRQPHKQQSVVKPEIYNAVVEQISSRIEDHFYQTDKKVVVLDFVDENGNAAAPGRGIAEDISIKLSNIARGFRVLNRNDFLATLGESTFAPASLSDPEKRKLVRNRTGAHAVITGTIFPVGQDLKISYRGIEVATGNLLFANDSKLIKTDKLKE